MANATFGERLKRLREKAGLTQEELAYNIGVSLKTIQRWEYGEQQPNIKKLQLLAAELHVSEEELLNGAPEATWVLHVEISNGNDKEDFINMGKPQSVIITSKDGAYVKTGGGYDLWTDNKAFNQLIADLKKLRAAVIQNGKLLGGIKS